MYVAPELAGTLLEPLGPGSSEPEPLSMAAPAPLVEPHGAE